MCLQIVTEISGENPFQCYKVPGYYREQQNNTRDRKAWYLDNMNYR